MKQSSELDCQQFHARCISHNDKPILLPATPKQLTMTFPCHVKVKNTASFLHNLFENEILWNVH